MEIGFPHTVHWRFGVLIPASAPGGRTLEDEFWTRFTNEKETEIMFRSETAAVVVLAVTAAFAQGTSPVTVPGGGPITTPRHTLAGQRGMSSLRANPAGGVQTPATLPQRIEDMQSTLTKMRAVLKQMRASSVKNHAKDPLAKANVDMWELLVGHLDEQLRELQAAQATRQDLEARRAALYKQADAKADAAARAARAGGGLGGGQASVPAPSTQGAGPTAGQSTAGQTPASHTPPQTSVPASPSPN